MEFHTYLLQNAKGTFYIGHTDDLEERLENFSTSRRQGDDEFGV